MRLRLRARLLELERERPLVMGIVNASPDSFSDAGRHRGLDAQLRRARQLVDEGAHLIDVGGESGVTNRPPVAADEEIGRVVPVVERLAADGVLVSVDTYKPAVARAALDAGAALINDVSGLRDTGMARACAEAGAGLVIMHTRVAPKEKDFPGYADVGADVLAFLRERIAVARELGVEDDQIVVDPGLDYAKTPGETIELLRGLDALHVLGRPLLLAVSRKDFVGALTGRRPSERLAGTLAAVAAGVDRGAAIVRVHDVAEVADYLRVRSAIADPDAATPDLALAEHLRREEDVA